ncbi:MAG: S41 family peptidase [Anaerolineales bacterium]|nr:S41 family peptidase [Anaerolineales bacterium]
MTRTTKIVAVLLLVGMTNLATFVTAFAVGAAAGNTRLVSLLGLGPSTEPAAAGTPASLADTFKPFWQAWDIVHAEYVEQPVDDLALMRGAIRGMLAALGDPHTGYMTPEELTISMTHLDGELEGIGATVETDAASGYTRIVSPMPGSPAEAAGLLPADLIITVDGEDIAGQDINTVVSKVRGPAGSEVTLEIQRTGDTDLRTFTVTRAKITIASVESELRPDGVGYVRLNSFGEKTGDELKRQLRDLLAQSPRGLILDLRGNPGGYLDAAIKVVSQFIPDGVVMLERFGDGSEKTYRAESGGLATQIPLVVLIDKGSASASEIVAGAIQDRGRGQLVGEQSYGKGSVQAPHELTGDGAIRVTIARWLTPAGHWIHGTGITPDVTVERTEADRAAGQDPQLDKAVELLTGN